MDFSLPRELQERQGEFRAYLRRAVQPSLREWMGRGEIPRAFFTEEVIDMVTGIYGVAPKIEYLDVLEFVDNSGT